jgi:hypothetical protein
MCWTYSKTLLISRSTGTGILVADGGFGLTTGVTKTKNRNLI